ncbi:hypothetical protein IKG07_01405 [Candidatus Saccharibacteria bacterium]|nr:hypothetical protein [Candidatus Saccharibacteria bacterium]
MKIKSKYIFIPVLTLTMVFAAMALASGSAFAATGAADAAVNVVPACTFTTSDYTITIPVAPGTLGNSESITRTDGSIETTCNGLNGWKIQAIGYSPDSTHPTGDDGLTSMYSPVSGGLGNFIPTGTSGSNSYWSFKITSVSSDTTTASILNGYGSYSNIPSSAVDVANYTGDGAGGTVTGHMRPDYQIYASGGQAPGTYTGQVKYTIVVNP